MIEPEWVSVNLIDAPQPIEDARTIIDLAFIKAAKGEYIGFVDSDDWVDLNAYEKFYENAKSHNSDIVMCPINLFDDTIKELTTDSKYDQPYFTLEYFNKHFDNRVFTHKDTKDFLFRISVTAYNKIYKTEFLNNINAKFPTNLIFEDMPFFYETYLQASNVSLIRDFLYFYRINRNDSIKSKADKNFFDIIKINDIIKKIFIETDNFNEYKSNLLRYIINNYFYRFNQVDESYKQEFFELIHESFIDMDLESDEIVCELHPHLREFIMNDEKNLGYIQHVTGKKIKLISKEGFNLDEYNITAG